ncbi:hypothetical protein PUN28_006742 [Cardiocondyla obscurior]|uniref:Uncharacterized protein n=1 Tax=Cardiocondyla obscurior TaxID=286306 RepID=A0AAW2G1W8_9HYME
MLHIYLKHAVKSNKYFLILLDIKFKLTSNAMIRINNYITYYIANIFFLIVEKFNLNCITISNIVLKHVSKRTHICLQACMEVAQVIESVTVRRLRREI